MEWNELETAIERLSAAASLLENAAATLASEESIGRIVATVEARRETDLEQKLAAAEAEIAQLRASATSVSHNVTNSRKTLPAAATNLLTKHGVNLDSIEASALDAALVSLSLEQRIAVKAQLMRAGLLTA